MTDRTFPVVHIPTVTYSSTAACIQKHNPVPARVPFGGAEASDGWLRKAKQGRATRSSSAVEHRPDVRRRRARSRTPALKRPPQRLQQLRPTLRRRRALRLLAVQSAPEHLDGPREQRLLPRAIRERGGPPSGRVGILLLLAAAASVVCPLCQAS